MFYSFSFSLRFWKIQLCFRILILVSIPSNFSNHLDLRGKIAAKFLIRSHFPQYKTISQKKYHIKRGAIQKLCRLHNGIFHPMQLFATLSQFYSNTSTVLFTKLHLETIDEKKEDFFQIWLLQPITLYRRR